MDAVKREETEDENMEFYPKRVLKKTLTEGQSFTKELEVDHIADLMN